MLKIIRDDFWPVNLFPDDFPKYEKTFKWITFALIGHSALCIIVVQIWMLFPYVEVEEGTRQMPILCWYPIDISKSPIYEVTYALIDICGINVMFGVVGFDMLFGCIVTHLCVQYQLLNTALSTICTKQSIFGNNPSEEQSYRDLVFCVKHHLKLSRFERRS